MFALFITYRVYQKNKHSMEPLHIYLLNYMAGYTLRIALGVMVVVDNLAQIHYQDYCPFYLFGLFVIIFFNLDVILMQIDRTQAVYWNIEYPSRFTPKRALRNCIASKVIAAIVTILVARLDPSYCKCIEPFALFYLKNTNIYLDAYPSMVVSIILFANTIYMAVTMVKLDKKLHHHIKLLPLTTTSTEGSQSKDKRNKNKIEPVSYEQKIQDKEENYKNLEDSYEIKMKCERSKIVLERVIQEKENLNVEPTKVTKLTFQHLKSVENVVEDQDQIQHSEEIHSKRKKDTIQCDKEKDYHNIPSISGNVQKGANLQTDTNNKESFKIQRKDKCPHQFYKIRITSVQKTDSDTMQQITAQIWKQNKEVFLVAKAALNLNLITVLAFLIKAPISALAILFQNCRDQGDCELFDLFDRILGPIRIILIIVHFLLILRKTKNVN